MRRALVLLAFLCAAPLVAQPRPPLTRALADALYLKLTGGTVANLTVTGTCTGCGSSGTVSTVGAGTIASIFTFSVANPTTTPAISLSFTAQLANCILAGPTSGGSTAPTCRAMVAADLPVTAVTPGAYTNANITVDSAGRLTTAASGSSGFTAPTGTGAVTVTSGTLDAAATVIASTPTASTILKRDANANSSVNAIIPNYATTATAGGTTTLTVASAYAQFFTGVLTQIVTLPVASTMTLGQSFLIVNNGTNANAVVSVKSSGANLVSSLRWGTSAIVMCVATSGTDATSWRMFYNGALGDNTSVNPFTATGGVGNPAYQIGNANLGIFDDSSYHGIGFIANGAWDGTLAEGTYNSVMSYGGMTGFWQLSGTNQNGLAPATGFAIRAPAGTGSGRGGDVTLLRSPSLASGGTLQTPITAQKWVSQGKALTGGSPIALFDVALPTLKMTSGKVAWGVQATDGTNMQAVSGEITYSAVNKGGVYTTDIETVSSATPSDAITPVIGWAKSLSSGTLTNAWTVVTGTNKITITLTSTTSLTTSGTNAFVVYYTIINNSEQEITVVP